LEAAKAVAGQQAQGRGQGRGSRHVDASCWVWKSVLGLPLLCTTVHTLRSCSSFEVHPHVKCAPPAGSYYTVTTSLPKAGPSGHVRAPFARPACAGQRGALALFQQPEGRVPCLGCLKRLEEACGFQLGAPLSAKPVTHCRPHVCA